MKEQITILVEQDAERLDKFLTEILKEKWNFSRTTIQKWIAEGLILVNDIGFLPSKTPIFIGDKIKIMIPESKKSSLQAEAIEFEIIYQDKDLLIVNKPNNLVVHPGAGNNSGTLVNGLLNSVKDLSAIGGVERPGVVHRLDKQTTGLLIVAKNDQTHQELSKMMAKREVYKEYLVLVWGVISEEEGIIEAPIGRHQNNRKKMAVTIKNSKYAKTSFKVLQRFANTTLVSCWIETGRTHQIRVHFSFINHPVLNDPLYGRLSEKPTSFGQYLHASKLIFNHPWTKQKMKFLAPLPQEFNDKIKALKEEK